MTRHLFLNSSNRIGLMLLVVLLLGLIVPAVSAQVGTSGFVNTGNLNVRTGPGIAFPSVAKIPNNTEVIFHGRALNSTWVQITVRENPSIAGWVNSLYLRTFADIRALPITYNAEVPPPPPTTGSGQRVHIVGAGETLQTIAARYGTTWQALAAANNLVNANFIYTGQRLIIAYPGQVVTPPPTGGNTTGVHVVAAGETLQIIAARYGTTWQSLASINGLANPNAIYVGQRLILRAAAPTQPPANARYHVVQPGENLYRIGLRYGLQWNVIAAANGIYNANAIYTGQRLYIPW